MTARAFARSMISLAAVLASSSCVKGGAVEVPPGPSCNCSGVFCVQGKLTRRSPGPDNGEGDNPCLSCNYNDIGTCADGCATTDKLPSYMGCPVAYACATWTRAAVGDPCSTDVDCEPGASNNTLVCRSGACGVDEQKFAAIAAKPCDTPAYQSAPGCDGRACIGQDAPSDCTKQPCTCAAARCIDSSDCPTGWHCQCLEEQQASPSSLSQFKGWWWCLPDLPSPDAGP